MSFDFDKYCEDHPDFNDAINGKYKEETASIFDDINKEMKDFFDEIDKVIGVDDAEADYWEQKAELHYEK
mgnify:CR=1 FL=1